MCAHRGDEIQEGPQGDDLYYKVLQFLLLLELTQGAAVFIGWEAGLLAS
jgi:hypothetical protein